MDTPSGEELRERYGHQVRETNAAMALRLLGKRAEIHPDDVIAHMYDSLEAAEAFAAGNLEHHNAPTIGPMVTDCGILAAVDIRGQMAAAGGKPTDPALPDDWWKP